MIEYKEAFLTHDELCEMLGVSKEYGLLSDENSLLWWAPAGMWKLSMRIGTKEEIEQLIM